MTQFHSMRTISGPVCGSVRPPGSKSITNRALVCAALASGTSVLSGVLDSDDTRVMIDSLSRLGFEIEHNRKKCVVQVDGCAGQIPVGEAELFIGNSGTSVRFLTAMLALAGGNYRIDGVARMRERPIGPLVVALSNFGCDVRALSPGGCPPVHIGDYDPSAGSIQIAGNLSSQYLSGLLMAAPLLKRDVTIRVEGKLVSRPYVAMTIEVMRSFGVDVEVSTSNELAESFHVSANQSYRCCEYSIEPDASAASYFFAVPAIVGGSVTVEGLNANSLQGDVDFVRCLQQMGCEVSFGENSTTVSGQAVRGIDVDMSDISDTVQTLAAVALFVEGPTKISNVAHNRIKETDRIGNLVIELKKLGVEIDERPDGLTIHPRAMSGAQLATYDDHRMAMSFALIGLRQPGIVIENPTCVSKTYPNFFRDLEQFVIEK